MEINKWIGCYKVQVFPWIDNKNIYVNVQYYAPGSSISQPPLWDKSALITDSASGKKFVYEFTSTCVEHIARLTIPSGGMANITVN